MLEGMLSTTSSEAPILDKVRRLSNETGIWWMWSDAERDLVKVPIDEWKQIYASKRR
jgi:hypothetical protein